MRLSISAATRTRDPEVIGGIAYVDRSRLTDAAEFRHLDAMLVITFSGMGLVTPGDLLHQPGDHHAVA